MGGLNDFGLAIFLAFVASVLVGFAVHMYLMSYLRRIHTQTWEQIGRPRLFYVATSLREIPSMLRHAWEGGNRTFRFIYFGNSHKELGDDWLNILIWLLRILSILIIALFILSQFITAPPRRWSF
jgi:hypothetical protein